MRPERYSYSYANRGGISRSLWARLGVAAMVLLAIMLLVMARSGNAHLVQWRLTLMEWVHPLVEVVTVPVAGVRNLMADKAALFRAYEENKQLQQENETLKHWQTVALTLKAENENLRQIARYKPVEDVEYVTAKVIAQGPENYSGTLMINAGSDQGLHALLPVIDADGLVGRLVDIGETTARVLLLTDALSRVPVVTATSRQRAILAGTGEELLPLTFVTGNAKTIELGEAVLTTAQGGLIPEGIMVGTVFRRQLNGTLLVKPVRPLARSEYVRVVVTP